MRGIFVFFLLTISTLCFSNTGKVTGFVTLSNGEPAALAVVYIEEMKKYCSSNDKGWFELTGIPYGKCQIEVKTIEAEPYKRSIVVDKPVVKLSIKLKSDAGFMLDDVVVVGKNEASQLKDKGFAVNMIETQKLALQSVQTTELLNRTSGVRVRQSGGMGASTSYNLNGMSGNSVTVFVDGIPISTYGASFSLNSIPPSMIERIEVYKGVIPAYLSDDALGGAINVVLKKGMRNSLTASLLYGSFNTQQANFNALYRDEKSGFTVKTSGFYNYSDNDYEVWGKFVRNILPNGRYDYVRAKRFNDAYKSIGGRLDVGFTGVKWADRFYIGYNGSDAYNEIQHGTYMSIPYMGRHTDAQAHVFSVDYRKKNLFVKGLEFTLNGMHSRRKEVVTDTVKWNYNWNGEISLGLDGEPILRPNGAQQGSPTLNHIDRNITTFRTGLSYDIHRNHRVLVNHIFYLTDRDQQDFMKSEAERDFVETRDLQKNITSLGYEVKAFNDRLTATVFGKYYQQKIEKMDPSLEVVNGESVRVEDRMSRKKTAKGYGLTFSYAFLRQLQFQTSAERAVRMPTEGEVFGSPGDNVIENTALGAEISDNLNLGVKVGPFRFNSHRLDAAVSLFIRDTKDKIVQQISTNINDAVQTAPYENLGKTKAKGFEVEFNYSYDRKLDVSFNLSRFNSVFNTRYDSNGREYDYYNKQLPNEPYFTMNGMVKYMFRNLLQKRSMLNLHYNCGFVESFYTTWLELEDFEVPRQFIQDVGLSYLFPNKRFVVSFDIKNILDKQAYDNFAVQKPGRAFYIKLNYTINKF